MWEKSQIQPPEPSAVEASRTKVGMMDIIDYTEAASSIDDAIYGNPIREQRKR